MFIPAEVIKKIQDEADIVEVIGEKVKLAKKGANYVGLCPFHNDTNPSLTVSPTKKIYTCFSCGASGDVLKFVSEYEKISFVEAAANLANKIGISIDLGKASGQSQILKKYYDIIEKATNFYEFYLYNTTDGQEALKYLYKRGLSDEIIKRFRIGLAPKESDRLYKALLQDKHQPLDMIEAGLIRSGSQGYYDIFRGRIMFPLEDAGGNIAGFSGRVYRESDTEAKYLNSSENSVFKKSRILYNFTLAQEYIRQTDNVFLFEGFLDVIAAHKAEINNTVAIMGTALTDQQIKAITRLSKNIILCFDGDDAGRTASRKAIYHLTKEGINAKAVFLPDKYDPDDYFNKYGSDAFFSLLTEKQLSGIDFLYELETRNLNLSDILSIEEFKKNIFRHLNVFNSNVINEIYLNKTSELLQISTESLYNDFKKNSFRPEFIDNYPKTVEKRRRASNKYEKSEKCLIKTLVHNPSTYAEVKDNLEVYSTENPCNRSIIYKLLDYYKVNDAMNIGEFKSTLDHDEELILMAILESHSIGVYIEATPLLDNLKNYKYYKATNEIRNETLSEETLKNFGKNKNSITRFKE